MAMVEQARASGARGDATGHTRYHLSAEQVRFFDENGYLVLRDWISADLLAKLQEAAAGWIADGQRVTRDSEHYADYNWAKRQQGRTLYRVNYVHNKGYPVSLELLGSPQVLGVAESLCGPNFVPTYESLVFKQEGDGEKIAWHQDAAHPRRWRIFNFDLYLDASRWDAGALRVIPGTQTEKQDICELAERHGWTPPGVIAAEMAPGDVLLHDVMVVHGSPHTEGKALRRTIYYEFRPAEQIREEGPWDRDWVERRLRLIPPALRRYREAYPDADQFDWRVSDEYRPAALGDEDVELKVAHTAHTLGSYCSAGDAPGKKAV